jgi:hypothetical protein
MTGGTVRVQPSAAAPETPKRGPVSIPRPAMARMNRSWAIPALVGSSRGCDDEHIVAAPRAFVQMNRST